jgi:hypothetical protein
VPQKSLVEQLEFLAKTSQDPVDAQGLREAAAALSMCVQALSLYACVCQHPCSDQAAKENLCGLRAKNVIKAIGDGRSSL